MRSAAHPCLGSMLDALPSEPSAPASADQRRAPGPLTRMTSYLEKAESLTPLQRLIGSQSRRRAQRCGRGSRYLRPDSAVIKDLRTLGCIRSW
jgi:hypothetical protein